MDLNPKHFTNKTINLKLDEKNYLQWKQQFCLSIVSHILEGYLDGSRVEEMIINVDGYKSVNPSYRDYKEKDSALLSWFLT